MSLTILTVEPQIKVYFYTWAKNSWTWSTFHFFISSLLGSFMLIMITSISSDHIKLVTVTAVLQCCSAAGVHCMQCLHNICNLVSWRRSSPNNIGPSLLSCSASAPAQTDSHPAHAQHRHSGGDNLKIADRQGLGDSRVLRIFLKKLCIFFKQVLKVWSLVSENGFQ